MDNKELIIKMCGEVYDLQTAIVSGRTKEVDGGAPISYYFGKLDLEEILTLLYYTNRTVIKLLIDHFGVDFQVVDTFLLSAVNEALLKEENILNGNQPDEDKRTVVRFENDQN